MATILVEDRIAPLARPALDAIAETCRGLGHEVFRWRGPFSGPVGHWRRLFPCDLAVLFNGTHPRYRPYVHRLRMSGAKLLYVEVGWNPQRGTCQIDPCGINAAASWSKPPLEAVGDTPLAVRDSGELLVVLQLDNDTQITQHSPHFRHMRGMLEFLGRHSQLPIRVRQHPLAPPDDSLRQLVIAAGGRWDTSPSLAQAMVTCRAVACVNSSCGVEAMAAGLPVLCYGEAVYRHPGAVYCLDGNPENTRQATAELAAGRCSLSVERTAAALARVSEHQWPHAEIPQRLPALIEQQLAERGPRRIRTSRFGRFVRDLPSRAPWWRVA